MPEMRYEDATRLEMGPMDRMDVLPLQFPSTEGDVGVVTDEHGIGMIVKSYDVYCGSCLHWSPLDPTYMNALRVNTRGVRADARAKGWRSRAGDWTCPCCLGGELRAREGCRSD